MVKSTMDNIVANTENTGEATKLVQSQRTGQDATTQQTRQATSNLQRQGDILDAQIASARSQAIIDANEALASVIRPRQALATLGHTGASARSLDLANRAREQFGHGPAADTAESGDRIGADLRRRVNELFSGGRSNLGNPMRNRGNIPPTDYRD